MTCSDSHDAGIAQAVPVYFMLRLGKVTVTVTVTVSVG